MPPHVPRIEAANALDISTFVEKYFPYPHSALIRHPPGNSTPYAVHLETSSTISTVDLEACFSLVALTSSQDYANSSIKWSPAKKRKEMRLPDLRYILLKRDTSSPPDGFLSFMLTYEDGHEVVYCYEIHLADHLRRCGLGAQLVQTTEDVGRRVGVEKLMLTVFLANHGALAFYKRLGYVVDDFSPEPRTLRGGVKKEPDYVILSKRLDGDNIQEDSQSDECLIARQGT